MFGGLRKGSILLGALFALAGCSNMPQLIPADLRATLFAEPAAAAPASIATTATVATAQPAPSAPSPAIRPVVAVARPPALAKLRDLSAAELVALIGEPDFRRVEPPAELWQYRSTDCVLDLFLYGDGQKFHVVHAAARDRDVTRSDPARCGDGAEVLRGRMRESKS